MDIKSTQKKLFELLKNVEYPRIATIIGLQEEIGNLSGCIMDIEIYNDKTKIINLGKNTANTLFSLIDICNAYDIDLEFFSFQRLCDIESRISSWEKDHGKNLEKLRYKLD